MTECLIRVGGLKLKWCARPRTKPLDHIIYEIYMNIFSTLFARENSGTKIHECSLPNMRPSRICVTNHRITTVFSLFRNRLQNNRDIL